MIIRRALLGMLLLLIPTLSGCFQVERVVTVRQDGSATVEETFLLSKKALSAMGEALGDSASAQKTDLFDFVKEDDLKKAASSMGEGVSFLKSEKISNEQFVGYKAVYNVRDINLLLVSSEPPKVDGKPGAADASKSSRFIFTPGSPATLVLRTAKSDKTGRKDAESKAVEKAQSVPTAEELAMIRQMFDGMRFAFSIKFDGKIVETNATHREANRIVMADVDFSKFLEMAPEELGKLNNLKDSDMATAMVLLKNFPGVKVDLNEEVKVIFEK